MGLGLGFNNRNGVVYKESTIYDTRHQQAPAKLGIGLVGWVKVVTSIFAAVVVLGGLIWGAAFIVSNMATDAELDKTKDRIEIVEKNDIRQTLILEHIQKTLGIIERKLDSIVVQGE